MEHHEFGNILFKHPYLIKVMGSTLKIEGATITQKGMFVSKDFKVSRDLVTISIFKKEITILKSKEVHLALISKLAIDKFANKEEFCDLFSPEDARRMTLDWMRKTDFKHRIQYSLMSKVFKKILA